MRFLPTREGWCLEVDHPNLNFKAFRAAMKEAKMRGEYLDKGLAEDDAKTLTERIGIQVHVFKCFF